LSSLPFSFSSLSFCSGLASTPDSDIEEAAAGEIIEDKCGEGPPSMLWMAAVYTGSR
jgi:hypothetical protein